MPKPLPTLINGDGSQSVIFRPDRIERLKGWNEPWVPLARFTGCPPGRHRVSRSGDAAALVLLAGAATAAVYGSAAILHLR